MLLSRIGGFTAEGQETSETEEQDEIWLKLTEFFLDSLSLKTYGSVHFKILSEALLAEMLSNYFLV